MDQLATVLTRYVGAPVYNQTGLAGTFDVAAQLAPVYRAASDLCFGFGCQPATSQATAALPYPPARLTDSSTAYDWALFANPDARGPASSEAIFDAIQKELGLKLESTKGPGDVVVIDHVARPIVD